MNRKFFTRHIRRCAVRLAGICVLAGIVYGCNQGVYHDAVEELAVGSPGVAGVRSLDAGMLLKDSVAYSDELWEFAEASKALMEKYAPYGEALTVEACDSLMERANDDEFMEALWADVNVDKELERLNRAQEALYQRTAYLKLTEEEQAELFCWAMQSGDDWGIPMLKTREETALEKACESARQEAYRIVNELYDRNMTNCRTDDCKERVTKHCVLMKHRADLDYLDCIGR